MGLALFSLSYLILKWAKPRLNSSRRWEEIKNRPKRRINRRLGRFESLFVNNIVSSGKKKEKIRKNLPMTQDASHLEPHLLSRHVGRVLTLAILRLETQHVSSHCCCCCSCVAVLMCWGGPGFGWSNVGRGHGGCALRAAVGHIEPWKSINVIE